MTNKIFNVVFPIYYDGGSPYYDGSDSLYTFEIPAPIGSFGIYLSKFTFDNGNNGIHIKFDDSIFNGYKLITLKATWSYQNAVGLIPKNFWGLGTREWVSHTHKEALIALLDYNSNSFNQLEADYDIMAPNPIIISAQFVKE